MLNCYQKMMMTALVVCSRIDIREPASADEVGKFLIQIGYICCRIPNRNFYSDDDAHKLKT